MLGIGARQGDAARRGPPGALSLQIGQVRDPRPDRSELFLDRCAAALSSLTCCRCSTMSLRKSSGCGRAVSEPDPKAWAACPLAAERPLSKLITAARSWSRERVFMPHSGPSRQRLQTAPLGSDLAVRPQSRRWPAGTASPASHPVAMPGRRAWQSAGGRLPKAKQDSTGHSQLQTNSARGGRTA
jgi:hypothetical protein